MSTSLILSHILFQCCLNSVRPFPVTLIDSSVTQRQLPSQNCNGRADLCHLRFDQITLLGSHNAGSYGYRRTLKCVYGNHNVDEVGQLDRGARLLDMDVCLRDGVVRTCHGRGKIAQILRPLDAALQDVARWIKAHPQEVVMLSFGDNDPADAVSKAKQAKTIAELLDKYFGGPGLALRTSDVSQESDGKRVWPTLGDMISSGRRVVVAFEGDASKPKNDLFVDLTSSSPSRGFVFNLSTGFHYTYSKTDNTKDYQVLLKYLKHYCSASMDQNIAVHFDAFLKPFRPRINPSSSINETFLAVERDDACFCNECTAKKLNTAITKPRGSSGESVLERAYRECAKHDIHVHAIKVDFEEYGDVGSIIWRLNDENVRKYCPSCHLQAPVADWAPVAQKSSAMNIAMPLFVLRFVLWFMHAHAFAFH